VLPGEPEVIRQGLSGTTECRRPKKGNAADNRIALGLAGPQGPGGVVGIAVGRTSAISFLRATFCFPGGTGGTGVTTKLRAVSGWYQRAGPAVLTLGLASYHQSRLAPCVPYPEDLIELRQGCARDREEPLT
jgi:hypothetical protein